MMKRRNSVQSSEHRFGTEPLICVCRTGEKDKTLSPPEQFIAQLDQFLPSDMFTGMPTISSDFLEGLVAKIRQNASPIHHPPSITNCSSPVLSSTPLFSRFTTETQLPNVLSQDSLRLSPVQDANVAKVRDF